MMPNKRLLVIGLGVVIIVAAIGFGIYGTTLTPNSSSTNTPEVTAPETSPAAEVTDDLSGLYLGNLEILMGVYSESEYLFINDTLVDFAFNSLGISNGLSIDTVSFTKRDNSSYGFMVRDANNNRLLYAIVTKQPDKTIKVEEYIQ